LAQTAIWSSSKHSKLAWCKALLASIWDSPLPCMSSCSTWFA
jgi:hypothetical protein